MCGCQPLCPCVISTLLTACDAQVGAERAVLAVARDVAPAVEDVPEGVRERVAADVREGQRREGQAAANAQVVEDDAGQLQRPGVPDLGRVDGTGPDRSAGLQAGVGAEPVALYDGDELGHAVGVPAAERVPDPRARLRLRR